MPLLCILHRTCLLALLVREGLTSCFWCCYKAVAQPRAESESSAAWQIDFLNPRPDAFRFILLPDISPVRERMNIVISSVRSDSETTSMVIQGGW